MILVSISFILSSTFLGSVVILFIKQSQWLFTMQTFAGWVLGSMISSTILFFTTYFYPLTQFHAFCILCFQVLLSFALLAMIYLNYLKQKKIDSSTKKWNFTIQFEKTSSLYLALVITGFSMLKYSESSYHLFPEILPAHGRAIIENEHAFISSILSGINYKRSHFLLFKDPYLINQSYTISALPHLYASCLMALGSTYPDASTLINFMNILATTTAVFLLAHLYDNSLQLLIVLIYLFNGGSILWNLFFEFEKESGYIYNQEIDNVRDFGRGPNPHYNIFAVHLGLSKISSFSIPLAIYALSFIQATQTNRVNFKRHYFISGLMAAFIPSLSTSIAFFILASNYSVSFTTVMPFALSIVFKFYKSSLKLFPLWREYQMNGIFFSQILTFVDSIGIPYLFIFFVPFFYKEYYYFHRFLTFLAAFVFLCFVREGFDTFGSDIAISAIFVPFVAGNFVKILNSFKCSKIATRSKQARGVANFLYYFLLLYVILSGIISVLYIDDRKCYGLDGYMIQCGKWISHYVMPNETVLADAKGMNPAPIMAGRQVVLGRNSDLWRRGEVAKIQSELFEEILMSGKTGLFMVQNKIRYLLEYKANPFVVKNETLAKHFRLIEENAKWMLLRIDENSVKIE